MIIQTLIIGSEHLLFVLNFRQRSLLNPMSYQKNDYSKKKKKCILIFFVKILLICISNNRFLTILNNRLYKVNRFHRNTRLFWKIVCFQNNRVLHSKLWNTKNIYFLNYLTWPTANTVYNKTPYNTMDSESLTINIKSKTNYSTRQV